MDNSVGLKPSDGFLKAVERFHPDLARPELWSGEALKSFLPDGDINPLHLFIHRVLDNMLKMGIHKSLEPGLITMYILGYYAGQQQKQTPNTERV